jgi:energy-coupling factor transporter ATP-binding protein EcfA2
MLDSVEIKQFTVFREFALDCSPGLNVVVGENSSGKSHLLKLLYALIATSASSGKQPHAQPPTKAYLQKAYGEKLQGVFRPESLGRLVSRRQGRERCELDVAFDNPALDVGISFATNSKTDVQVDTLPSVWEAQSPLYLPTRELLTIYPNFVSIYEGHYLEFEETWRDTCIHLGGLLQKGPRTVQTAKLIDGKIGKDYTQADEKTLIGSLE